MLEGHQLVLLAQPIKVQVELPGHDHLREILDNRRIQRDLNLEDTQDIVQCVEACHRIEAHEIGDTQKILWLEVFELGILSKYSAELQQICGKSIL